MHSKNRGWRNTLTRNQCHYRRHSGYLPFEIQNVRRLQRRQSRQTNFPIFLGIHGPRNRSSSKMTIRPRLRTRPDRVLGWDNLLMITNQGNVSTAFPLFLCQSVDQKLKFLVKFFQLFFEQNFFFFPLIFENLKCPKMARNWIKKNSICFVIEKT